MTGASLAGDEGGRVCMLLLEEPVTGQSRTRAYRSKQGANRPLLVLGFAVRASSVEWPLTEVLGSMRVAKLERGGERALHAGVRIAVFDLRRDDIGYQRVWASLVATFAAGEM